VNARIVFQAAPGRKIRSSAAPPSATTPQTIKLGTANTAATGPKFITIQGLTVTGAPAGAAILAAGGDTIVIANCKAHTSGSGIVLTQTPNSIVQDCEVDGVAMTPGTPGQCHLHLAASALRRLGRTRAWRQRNRIDDCTGIGFFMGGAGSATGQVRDNVVVNNAIWNCLGNATYPGGIVCRRATVFHLGVQLRARCRGTEHPTGAPPSKRRRRPPSCRRFGPMLNVSNNIVHHSGSGARISFDVTTAVVPTTFDYNLDLGRRHRQPVGRVGTVNYATSAAWQALAAPSLAGKETNTIAAVPAGFVNPYGDLHILPSSQALATGSMPADPVVDDFDQQPRSVPPCRGADERNIPPLYAAFALPTTTTAPAGFGPFAFAVGFVEQSQSNSPTGADVAGVGLQRRQHRRLDGAASRRTPTRFRERHTVSLTVTDPINGSAHARRART
jgi:hypothetical protein